MSASTEPREADAPFNDKNADIILRSSDNVSFHTYKNILSLASPVFQAMFSLPQPANTSSPTLTITAGDPPTIDVAEDARTLDLILRCCYPVRRPSITQLSDVHRVLEAGRKYDLDAATAAAESALTACTAHDVLGAFALACRYQLRETCTAVARRTLAYELGTLDAPAQVDLMSVTQYRALVAYHARCCVAAAEVARHRRSAWMLASQDGRPADEWPQALSNRSYLCKVCASAPVPDENLYAPKVWDALRRAGDALTQRICVGGEVWDAWAPEKPRCDGCKRTYDRLKLWRAFAAEVERTVAAVEVPQFC